MLRRCSIENLGRTFVNPASRSSGPGFFLTRGGLGVVFATYRGARTTGSGGARCGVEGLAVVTVWPAVDWIPTFSGGFLNVTRSRSR